MCWSLPVSIAFAVLEGLGLAFLCWRCFFKAAANELERQQRHVLPLLLSIFLIEVLESFLWAPSTALRPIAEASREGCTARNMVLTRAVAVVILTQPFILVWAARHTGDRDNMQLLYVSQVLAAITTVLLFAALLQGEILEEQLLDIANSDFRGAYGFASCSWVGEHGHIHWVWKMAHVPYAPLAYAYLLFTVSALFARPLHVTSGPLAVMLATWAVLAIAIGGMEAASVWCWTAIGLHAYFVAHPYVIARIAPAMLAQDLLGQDLDRPLRLR
jgi:hypothetical protein